MPTTKVNLTKAFLSQLIVPPGSGRLVVHDLKQKGLQVRVTASGTRTFSVLHRVRGGQLERETIGRFPDITIDAARDRAAILVGQHVQGISRAKAKTETATRVLTFKEALEQYVSDDSARKVPLKERTRRDYLEMVRDAGEAPKGQKHGAGELHYFASKPVPTLTGAMLKSRYNKRRANAPVRAAYAMRVMRAVLNYHGVRLADDPFSPTTPRKDRIVLPPANRRTRVIPQERIDMWWKVAGDAPNGDFYQLMLLTGMRRSEVTNARCSDVDTLGWRLVVSAPKNGKPHVVLLSKQAQRIVARRLEGKLPTDLLFAGAADPRKSLEYIKKESGVEFSAHDCRRTFITTAAALVPGYLLKTLANHSANNDVTAAHYVHLDEKTLRAGWQLIADAIVPGEPSPENEASRLRA